MDILF